MNSRKIHPYLILFLTILCCGCDINDQKAFEPEYIVESYLIALEPLPTVRLSKTVPSGRPYYFEDQAVSKASIRIKRISKNGEVSETYSYVEIIEGIYLPGQSNTIVIPGQTYELDISLNNNNTKLHASTFVPDSFSVKKVSHLMTEFRATEPIELTVTRSSYPGRQNIFILSAESLNPRLDLLTPFIKDIFKPEEDKIEDVIINESPPFNEGNYDINEDGTLTIKIPWIAFNFYGPNKIFVNAIDDNFFDFVRSRDIQTRGSTLSPGEIPAIIEHIDGGTGIFGSLSRISVEVVVTQPDSLN